MLILRPDTVIFDDEPLHDVAAIAIERAAESRALEWSDAGPHTAFADVPQQRVEITLISDLRSGTEDTPPPGRAGALSFYLAQASSVPRRRITIPSAVVLSSTYDIQQNTRARRTLRFIALSPNGGAADPVSITDEA
ncbi:MAG: hypothetical protein KF864_04485 [Phycisphaeraceae bacterium]|nr:hypothetical protein [Phycisphaeraceae bacterium]